MIVPPRGRTGHGTYFITASTWMKAAVLQSDRSARLFIEVMLEYREQNKFLLHEFVVMPEHFHLLLTPDGETSLERCLQLIKGGFSYRTKREIGSGGPVWQKSFYDHRVRDADEYQRARVYIHENPVRRGLARTPSEFPYSSASGKFKLDEVPRRLKPAAIGASNLDR